MWWICAGRQSPRAMSLRHEGRAGALAPGPVDRATARSGIRGMLDRVCALACPGALSWRDPWPYGGLWPS